MNVDPNGQIAWWIAKGLSGGVSTASGYLWDVFSSSNYKWKKFKKKVSYKKAAVAFIAGSLTGVLGAGLYKALLKGRVGIISRMIVHFQNEFKSELARNYTISGKVQIGTSLWNAGANVFSAEKKKISLIIEAYKRGGKTRALKIARR